MLVGWRRRRVLAAGVGLFGTALTGHRVQASGPPQGPDTWFDPGIHGFGFRNWGTETNPLNVGVSPVEESTIREVLTEEWAEPVRESVGVSIENVPELLISIITRQIYMSVNQLSGTNGHCYGMVFTAQRYYEHPEVIPLERTAASEITHPAEPLDDPEVHPVLDEIEWFHTRQFTDFYSWIGRRAVLRPSTLDYPAQLAEIADVVDHYGTAGITIVDSSDNAQHQVLVYDYEVRDDRAILHVYDPNQAASFYDREGGSRTIEIDFTGERPRMVPYRRGYELLVFNRYDRVVRARAEQRGPLAGTTEAVEALGDLLFSIALFLVASPTVSLVVLGPAGQPLERDRAALMDTDRTEYDDMRYRYGAEPGTYRIAVFGEEAGSYDLEVLAASPTAALLEATVADSIDAGEIHRYDAIIPESGEGEGHIERVSVGEDGLDPRLAAGAGAAATAAALGGYRYLAHRHNE